MIGSVGQGPFGLTPCGKIIGTGTYSDPLTFASAPGEFTTCEVIYVPYLKKYARFEDYCAQCSEFDSVLPFPAGPWAQDPSQTGCTY